MIKKCNLYELETLTGITPRDSWHTKARGEQVYYIKKDNHTIAFLYLKDAKQFLKSN